MRLTGLKRKAALLALFAGASASLRAAGTTSAEFLRAEAGARAAALGGTQAALADDAFAVYWNPAGLARLRAPEAAVMRQNGVEDVGQDFAAVAVPTKSAGVWAIAFDRVAVDPFPGYDAQGAAAGPVRSDGTAVAAAWGKRIAGAAPGGLAAGVAAKTVRETNAGVSASGFLFDAGFQWLPAAGGGGWLERLGLGLAARNVGQGPKFDKEAAPAPTTASLGLSYRHFLAGNALAAGVDAHRSRGEDAYASAGVEYWQAGFFALRAGFRSGLRSGGLRLGAGLRVENASIDYAWTGYGEDLGASHRVSLSWRFGPAGRVATGWSDEYFALYMTRGREAMNAGEFDRAVLDFSRAREIRPLDGEAARRLAECGEKLRATP
jgi:hypothetical protein